MNFPKNLGCFAPFSVILILLITPFAIQAADQADIPPPSVYLPLISNNTSDATGNLSNGGVYVGEGGVGLGALTGSLSGPINVTIAQTVAPTQTVPSQAQVLSDYFRIGTSSVITLTTDSPLILAFPVPVGANTTNLALALLESGEGSLDAESSSPAWNFMEGMYDPNKNLFLTTLASLDQAGETIALVEHADFVSPSNAALAGSSRISQPQVKQFNVKCTNFQNPTDCTTTTEIAVEDYLSDIYNHIQGDLNFHDPRLRFLNGGITFDPNSWSSNGYTAYIEPYDGKSCTVSHAGGYYSRFQGRLVLCLNPAVGLDPEAVYVLIHQYFHATQYGYLTVMNDWYLGRDEKWIIEGMAKTVEESFFSTEMLRSLIGGWVSQHKVDVPLKSQADFNEYIAQDFWVYTGQEFGQGMSYLDAVLTEGARTKDVVTVLEFGGSYLDEYWSYVKNQVMEAAIKQSGALGSPCSLYRPVVNQTVDFNYDFYHHTYQILNTLDPLTSVVVEVHWDFNYTGADGAAMPVDPTDENGRAALRFKLYQDGEAGCEPIHDGRRTFMNVDKTAKYYVVISNVDPTNAHNYLVGFETWPIPPAP